MVDNKKYISYYMIINAVMGRVVNENVQKRAGIGESQRRRSL